ncbi:MAG: InlB B-repeat-containing protein, partial [Clostridia bacterium]
MSKAKKIILIIVSILIAIGAGVGIYFIVKNNQGNTYTQLQKDFINDVVNDNKKPPVVIDPEKLPPLVSGDSVADIIGDGDKIIIDHTDGSQDIYEKNETGGYDKVVIDTGIAYDKIIQVQGDYAVVSSGNAELKKFAIINLKTGKLALDFKYYHEFCIQGDYVLTCTYLAYDSVNSTLDDTMIIVSELYDLRGIDSSTTSKSAVFTTTKDDYVLNIALVSDKLIIESLTGLTIYKVGATNVAEQKKYASSYVQSNKEDYHFIINNIYYKYLTYNSFYVLDNQTAFITSFDYSAIIENADIFYNKSFIKIKYEFLNLGTMATKSFDSNNYFYKAKSSLIEKYYVFERSSIKSNKDIDKSSTRTIFYTKDMTEVFSFTGDNISIKEYNNETDSFLVETTFDYDIVDKNGNSKFNLPANYKIKYVNFVEGFVVVRNDGINLALFSINGNKLTDYEYYNFSLASNGRIIGQKNNAIFNETESAATGTDVFDTISSYYLIDNKGNSVKIDNIDQTLLSSLKDVSNIIITKVGGLYTLENFNKEIIVSGASIVNINNTKDFVIIEYILNGKQTRFILNKSKNVTLVPIDQVQVGEGGGTSGASTGNVIGNVAEFIENDRLFTWSGKWKVEDVTNVTNYYVFSGLPAMDIKFNNRYEVPVLWWVNYESDGITLKLNSGYFVSGIVAESGSKTLYMSPKSLTCWGSTSTCTDNIQWLATLNCYYRTSYAPIKFDQNGGVGGFGNRPYFGDKATIQYNEPYKAYYGQTLPDNYRWENWSSSRIVKSSIPTRAGYTFNGYYSAASGGTQYYDANGAPTKNQHFTIAGAELTLYAQWTPNSNKINYKDKNGGNAIGSQINKFDELDNGKVMVRGVPTRYGYTFTGWKSSAPEGTVYAGGSECTELNLNNKNNNGREIDLTAQWEANNYKCKMNNYLDGPKDSVGNICDSGGSGIVEFVNAFDAGIAVNPIRFIPTKHGAFVKNLIIPVMNGPNLGVVEYKFTY